MAAGAKNLEQIMLFTEAGLLPPGSAICDIGVTQLQGAAIDWAITSFLDYYARVGESKSAADLAPGEIEQLANRGFAGDLFELAGFSYVALDIFHAKNTILFDLNAHRPGPKLKQAFDLVLNLGTTEHVVNQLAAQSTIYDLAKVDGIIYHDLPMSGYFGHGYFKYDPQFFLDLASANDCDLVLNRLSAGHRQTPPQGLAPTDWRDFGMEVAVRRRSDRPLRLPLETSTSLAVDPAFATSLSDYVEPIGTQEIEYAPIGPGGYDEDQKRAADGTR